MCMCMHMNMFRERYGVGIPTGVHVYIGTCTHMHMHVITAPPPCVALDKDILRSRTNLALLLAWSTDQDAAKLPSGVKAPTMTGEPGKILGFGGVESNLGLWRF